MPQFVRSIARRTLLAALPGALALAMGAPAADAAPVVEREIRIGSSAALSGPAAALGTRYHAGSRAYVEHINRQGGVHGMPVVIDLRDDTYEPARADANSRALVDDPRVLALFGYVGTPTSQAALAYVRRGQIPFIGAFTGAEMLRDPTQTQVFNVRASYRDEAKALALAMKGSGVRRLNVLYQADLFGRAGLEAIRDAAAAARIEIPAVSTVKRNTTEVDEGVAALVQQSSADAIFMVSTYESCAAFVKAARKKGFEGTFYTLSFAGLEPLRSALGREPRPLVIAQVVPDPHDTGLPVVAAYQKAMLDTGDKQFDSISLEGYLSAKVLVESLRRAKLPLSREALRRSLEGLGELDLGGFTVRYGNGDRGGSGFISIRTIGGKS